MLEIILNERFFVNPQIIGIGALLRDTVDFWDITLAFASCIFTNVPGFLLANFPPISSDIIEVDHGARI